MNIVGIIPARMDSSRFPGKPMANINGTPMIGHVYKRTSMCDDLLGTYVATCDKEISDYMESIGGTAIMTSPNHERASERSAEALLKIEERIGKKVDIVVMVQGDEPMVTSSMIQKSLEPFKDESVNVVNLMGKMETIEEFQDPNEVKVVINLNNDAIYFSREPIPSLKKGGGKIPMLKQVCVITFRRSSLEKFNSLPETSLERIESIDMNRLIEHGFKVRMVLIEEQTYSVDTRKDLRKVKKLLLER